MGGHFFTALFFTLFTGSGQKRLILRNFPLPIRLYFPYTIYRNAKGFGKELNRHERDGLWVLHGTGLALFSRKVDQWVERYYRIKNEDYRRILDGKSLDSKKWWNLHKQMKKDIHFLDEATEMSRSHLVQDLLYFYISGTISREELRAFSEDMQQSVMWELGFLARGNRKLEKLMDHGSLIPPNV